MKFVVHVLYAKRGRLQVTIDAENPFDAATAAWVLGSEECELKPIGIVVASANALYLTAQKFSYRIIRDKLRQCVYKDFNTFDITQSRVK